VRDADQRAGIVEHIDEKEAENDNQERRLVQAREINCSKVGLSDGGADTTPP
jgi:ribosomal protein L14E/L6E/L27E